VAKTAHRSKPDLIYIEKEKASSRLMTAPELGTRLLLRLAWSPSTGMVRATYRVEVESYEPRGDRFQCQLLELVEVSGVRSGSELTQEMLDRLVGQHVLVPREGLNGLILRLKMTTLTGGLKRPYFFNLSNEAS
jgi:hypothetical protein